MRLAWAGLSVCHYGPIVTIADAVKHWLPDSLKNLLLGTFKIENVIENEGDLFTSSIFVDNELALVADAMQALRVGIFLFLFFVEGPEAAEHFYVASLLLLLHLSINLYFMTDHHTIKSEGSLYEAFDHFQGCLTLIHWYQMSGIVDRSQLKVADNLMESCNFAVNMPGGHKCISKWQNNYLNY